MAFHLGEAEKPLLTIEEVVRFTTYSKPSIYRHIRAGEFPAPLRLGKGRSAWKTADVQGWLDSRPQPLRRPSPAETSLHAQ
jgi:prophage regulatory protein